eukprot:TRINITY_DN13382_c0_g1_i1.p1 TRINITY_DN13382_c0_g1~~TRINITY_DN13382_c0_g1_i1.p1  ORF type:complete len:349 (+),score=100.24 TRINITY_DN13382_c0_g1_i1:120-1166(+)
MGMEIFVRHNGGAPAAITIEADDTVADVGRKIEEAIPGLGGTVFSIAYQGDIIDAGDWEDPIAKWALDAGDELQCSVVFNPRWREHVVKAGTGVNESENDSEYVVTTALVDFPTSQNLNINMMPFIMALSFADTKLPEECKPYWDLMERLMCVLEREMGKVCYLSIDERDVEAGASHRREGLHTENPGCIPGVAEALMKGAGDSTSLRWYHHWGMSDGHLSGGIYFGSNVSNSCVAYESQVIAHPETGEEVIGLHGDVSHLNQQGLLGDKRELVANMIYWITDRTPHESLPLAEGTHRQWFRIVTSNVSLWFKDHSTANPNGVVPDPAVTKIVAGNKFTPHELRIVDS